MLVTLYYFFNKQTIVPTVTKTHLPNWRYFERRRKIMHIICTEWCGLISRLLMERKRTKSIAVHCIAMAWLIYLPLTLCLDSKANEDKKWEHNWWTDRIHVLVHANTAGDKQGVLVYQRLCFVNNANAWSIHRQIYIHNKKLNREEISTS
jgi:hypothetical protein